MIRRTLLGSVFVLAAGAASAADLPSRATAPVYAAPMFTWTGFYAGVNAGAHFNNGGQGISTVGLVAPNNVFYTGGNGDKSGFMGGVQVGYNMQSGSFVYGVEADLNYRDRKRGSNGVFPAPADLTPGFDDRTDFTVSQGRATNWFGTLRGRLGFAFDRVLVYGTGGLAIGGSGGSSSVTQRDYFEINPGVLFVTDIRTLASTSSKKNSVGWSLGGGFEYALSDRISLKLEYMHVDLGRSSDTFTTLASAGAPPLGPPIGATMTAGNRITVRHENKFDIVRAGVNYRF
jgi:outer membrane immunogenic protein